MKKNYFILVILLIMVVGYAATQMKIDIKGNTTLSENTSDFNVYLANLKLNGTEIEGINETKDGYEINIPSKGTLEYDVINDSTEYDVEATVECEEETGANEVTNFDYTGSEQTFVAPVTGVYKLETWGAQGGNTSFTNIGSHIGGYGGYSIGKLILEKNKTLYINVGERGSECKVQGTECTGGYNGGGSSESTNLGNDNAGTGAGATHIALSSGLLSTLENTQSNILIVSGGGGGSYSWKVDNNAADGGSAGGYIGSAGLIAVNYKNYSSGFGGTQTLGGNGGGFRGISGSFGQGGNGWTIGAAGGGAGFYGGGSSAHNGAGGGSGYIGNILLTNKAMYCYNCQESTEESTKTISTTCVSETPTENCAKSGNGYARITQMNPTVSSIQLETTIEAQDKVNKNVEISNNGMKCSLKIKKISRTEKKVYNGPTEWTFDYTGGEQNFEVPVTGLYKLETWGAQGGNGTNSYIGGYGGYSTGQIYLNRSKKIYINIGGRGKTGTCAAGGYNGGGISGDQESTAGSGGGATHIASITGILSSLKNNINSILIVSGSGGGGGYYSGGYYGIGGSGGGYIGNNGTCSKEADRRGMGGTQTAGGVTPFYANNFAKFDNFNGNFGQGGNYNSSAGLKISGGGGSGYYGGSFGGDWGAGGGGGSGYIGNSLLTNKSMYCYNCAESTEELTKTISTTCVNSTPTENCAKSGNGYARISLINN